MNYKRIYNELIKRSIGRILEGYTENHHIIPKCFGGSNKIENIAVLTAREHFIAHMLLYRIQTEKRKMHQMLTAVVLMSTKACNNSKKYQILRETFGKKHSILISGKNHPRYGIKGVDNPTYGITWEHTTETKQKLSDRKKGMVSALDIITGNKMWVSKEKFDIDENLVGQTLGSIAPIKGKKCINNGEKNKYVTIDDIPEYVELGWKLGNIQKLQKCEYCGREMNPGNLKRHKIKCEKDNNENQKYY